MISTDILIIGGGASGCLAAIEARRKAPRASILIAEKGSRLLEKVRKTGNGRCNISNTHCGSHREVEDFFSSIGVIFDVEADGRAYPYNRRSESVVAAITGAFENIGVMTGCRIDNLTREGERFRAVYDRDVIESKLCLIATGGKSGEGYIFARRFGHKVRTMVPSLTGMTVKEDISRLKGVRSRALVSLYRKGRKTAAERGEVQFAENYVSGICVMNLSRFLTLDDNTAFDDYTLDMDLVPDIDKRELPGLLKRGCIVSLVDERLAEVCDDISAFRLTVSGALGWEYAQVSRGGVELSEIGEDGESRLVPGLYLAGEVTDYDGPCGGYNLNNAWRGGIACGRAMGERCTG